MDAFAPEFCTMIPPLGQGPTHLNDDFWLKQILNGVAFIQFGGFTKSLFN